MNPVFLSAQSNNDDAAAAVLGLGIILLAACVGLTIFIVIQGLICWILSNCYKAIPAEHRKMEPGMVWLLFIPFFGIVWNYFVCLRLSDSYKSYFDARQDTSVGDCGRTLALTYCILVSVSVIPYLGACTGLAAVVLLIIMLIKFSEFKSRIQAQTN